jgi:hypothetical protein
LKRNTLSCTTNRKICIGAICIALLPLLVILQGCLFGSVQEKGDVLEYEDVSWSRQAVALHMDLSLKAFSRVQRGDLGELQESVAKINNEAAKVENGGIRSLVLSGVFSEAGSSSPGTVISGFHGALRLPANFIPEMSAANVMTIIELPVGRDLFSREYDVHEMVRFMKEQVRKGIAGFFIPMVQEGTNSGIDSGSLVAASIENIAALSNEIANIHPGIVLQFSVDVKNAELYLHAVHELSNCVIVIEKPGSGLEDESRLSRLFELDPLAGHLNVRIRPDHNPGSSASGIQLVQSLLSPFGVVVDIVNTDLSSMEEMVLEGSGVDLRSVLKKRNLVKFKSGEPMRYHYSDSLSSSWFLFTNEKTFFIAVNRSNSPVSCRIVPDNWMKDMHLVGSDHLKLTEIRGASSGTEYIIPLAGDDSFTYLAGMECKVASVTRYHQ